MKKYLGILKKSIQEGAVYRLDTINWMFIAVLSTIASILLFGNAAKAGAFLEYNQDQIIAYLVLSLTLERFLNWYLPHRIADNIRSGIISKYILKPYNFKLFYVLSELGAKAFMTIFYLLILIAFWILFRINLHTTHINIILGLISLALGSIINILVAYSIASISFWIIRSTAFINAFYLFVAYMQGRFLPLDIFPELLLNLVKYTPFPYTYFYTIKLFIGDTSKIEPNYFVIQILWIFILFLLAKYLWKFGIKNYEAVGI